MKMSRNYLIAALLLIALYLMFSRVKASGYSPHGGPPPREARAPRGPKTESEVALDRLLGRA